MNWPLSRSFSSLYCCIGCWIVEVGSCWQDEDQQDLDVTVYLWREDFLDGVTGGVSKIVCLHLQQGWDDGQNGKEIDVDHSGLIRSFPCNSSDPLTDLSIDTSLCWEGCKQKRTESRGVWFGEPTYCEVSTSFSILQTSNTGQLFSTWDDQMPWNPQTSLWGAPLWGNLPLVSICILFLSIFLVHFFFLQTSKMFCVWNQMKTGPLKPSRSGHGKVCFFLFLAHTNTRAYALKSIKMGERKVYHPYHGTAVKLGILLTFPS